MSGLHRKLLRVFVATGALLLSAAGCGDWIMNRFREPGEPGTDRGAPAGGAGGADLQACASCHLEPQDDGDGVPGGGRRAAAAEFPRDTVRGHLSGFPPRSADCYVCHDTSAHGSGTVVLLDPDGNEPYRFVTSRELASDPDLSDFCANCHDADGATRLATPASPFGGPAAPDVERKFRGTLRWREWYGGSYYLVGAVAGGTQRAVNSHHDISDEDQAWSGAKIECLSCHAGHASGATQLVSDPDAPTRPWRGDLDSFCLRCHRGGDDPLAPDMPAGVVAPTVFVDAAGQPCPPSPGPCSYEVSALRPLASCDYTAGPWWATYTYLHDAHGAETKRRWTGSSTAPSAALTCSECHDAHGSQSAANPAGNPYAIRDRVDGRPYVDDGNWQSGWLVVGSGGGGTGGAGGAGGTGGAEPITWSTHGSERDVVVTVTEGAVPPPAGTDYSLVDWGGPQGLCRACHTTWDDTGYTGAGGGTLDSSYRQHWHGFEGCQVCHGHGQGADSFNAYQAWNGCSCHSFPDGYHAQAWGAFEDTSCLSCGDGLCERFEQCDDGNRIDGDGCSNECTFEAE